VSRRKTVSVWILCTLSLSFFILIVPVIFAELINDGSFENAPSAWEEYFNNACNPSGIGDWSTISGGPANFDGQQSLWLGGICNVNPPLFRNNGARQTITLAEDAALLSFWFNPLKGTPDPLNLDRAFVAINDSEIWSIDIDGINNPTGWNNAIVDINQFADQTVTLTLEMQQNIDASVANVFIDAIEIFHPKISINQTLTPTAVLQGNPFSIEVTIVNEGDTPLNNITITNNTFTNCDRTLGDLPDLAPGESTNYICQESEVPLGMTTNTATVQATTTAIDYLVEDSSNATLTIINPLLTLAISPESVSLTMGEQVTFDLSLTNNGNTTIQNVKISSDPEIGCNLSLDTLAVGQTSIFNCTHTPSQSGSITFSAIGEENITNSQVYAETAVTIELLPVDPPTNPIHVIHLPIMLNNYLSHNTLGEPNNICSQTYPLSLNQPQLFLAEDIHDWYQFTLDIPGDLNVQLNNFAPVAGQITLWQGTCTNLTLIGQNGDFLATKSINLQNQPAGTYYVWLINDGSTTLTEKYELTITSP
jgi:hypothetical protein